MENGQILIVIKVLEGRKFLFILDDKEMMMSDYYVIDEVIHNLDCFIEWFGKVSTEDYFVLYLYINR